LTSPYPFQEPFAAVRPWCGAFEKKTLNFLIFQDRFDILLEMKLSGVAERLICEIPKEIKRNFQGVQGNGQKSPLNNPVAFRHIFCNWLSNSTGCRGRYPLAWRCKRQPLRLVFDKTLFVLRVTG
jgi:hypothetical protein